MRHRCNGRVARDGTGSVELRLVIV